MAATIPRGLKVRRTVIVGQVVADVMAESEMLRLPQRLPPQAQLRTYFVDAAPHNFIHLLLIRLGLVRELDHPLHLAADMQQPLVIGRLDQPPTADRLEPQPRLFECVEGSAFLLLGDGRRKKLRQVPKYFDDRGRFIKRHFPHLKHQPDLSRPFTLPPPLPRRLRSLLPFARTA